MVNISSPRSPFGPCELLLWGSSDCTLLLEVPLEELGALACRIELWTG
jgi:hypothetical protein